MYPTKTPKPEVAFRAAVVLALLPSGSLLGAALGIEAYQIDQWMSYEVKGVRIRPQLDINMMYNNNVFSASDVGVVEYVDPRKPTQTNRFTLNPRVADLIGTVSPGVSFQVGSENENYLNLEYQSDNTRYFDLGVATVPMHRIQLAGKYDNQSRLRMEGTHSTEFVSSFMGGWVNLGQTLVDRWSHATAGRVTYDSSEKTDVYFSGTRNYLNYEGVNLYGNDGWRGNLGASYKPTDRLSVFVEGGYGLTDFIRGTSALGFIPTSHVYGGFVGVRGQFTERLEGSIGGGYEIREFPDIPGASFSIPAANISVSYAFRETTKFSLAYIRRTDNAAQIARQGVTYATTTFNVQQALGTTGTWLATAGVSYQGGTFDSLTGYGVAYEPIAGTSLRSLSLRTVDYKRDDSMMSLSGGISYMPRRWLRFGLNYSYDNYSVNFADAGLKDVFLPTYDAHRVMVGVQIGY